MSPGIKLVEPGTLKTYSSLPEPYPPTASVMDILIYRAVGWLRKIYSLVSPVLAHSKGPASAQLILSMLYEMAPFNIIPLPLLLGRYCILSSWLTDIKSMTRSKGTAFLPHFVCHMLLSS